MNLKVEKRVDLAVKFTEELIGIQNEIKESASVIDSKMNDFYNKSFEINKDKLQAEISKYNKNIEDINNSNLKIVSLLNEWYNFNKDKNEISKVFFPINFKKNKKRITKEIQILFDKISEFTVENRFIREKISNICHQIEIDTIKLIKDSKEHYEYQTQIERKQNIINEIRYILPTIPGITPVEVNLDEIDCLIFKLNNLKS